MLKTIGTTALVIVAMLSCGTAQAMFTPEDIHRVFISRAVDKAMERCKTQRIFSP